jgi:transposase-like protein
VRSRAARARRWCKEIAKSVLEEQSASGMSVAEFARLRGIDAQRLYCWRRRLSSESGANTFLEVARPAEPIERATSMLEVVLRSGDLVRLGEGVNVADFRAIVEVLRAC